MIFVEIIRLYKVKISCIQVTNYYLNFSHGKQKFWTGAGLYGLGAVTGNSGLKNVGGGLVKLGLLTKGAAHFF